MLQRLPLKIKRATVRRPPTGSPRRVRMKKEKFKPRKAAVGRLWPLAAVEVAKFLRKFQKIFKNLLTNSKKFGIIICVTRKYPCGMLLWLSW